jgi:hypothetical protein
MHKWFIVPVLSAAAFAASVPTQPTFHKDVLPILQNRCQECHRPGEIGPFSLLSYKDARPWAKAIRSDVLSKKMPPWFADPAFGHFSNDRSLSKAEIDTLVAWVDGGAKEGDAKEAPAPRQFLEGWNIDKPDVVLQMKEPFHVPATGEVPYQYIVMPTNFTEDRWVQQVEVRPTDRSVVHHLVVFIRDPKSPWLKDAEKGVAIVPQGKSDFNNISGGGNEVLTIYTPGMVPDSWHPGLAKQIKAGSDLVVQIHYTPNGKKAVDDFSRVGIVFSKEEPTERALTLATVNLMFRIPPGDPNYKVQGRSTFPNGATIISFFPHMHLRGKAFEYTAVYPDGKTETLLRVPKYDFNWQLDYRLAQPLVLPPGTKVIGDAWFDNSANNPANPDPKAEVKFGEQSWEEMALGFFDAVIPAKMKLQEFFTPPKPKKDSD